MCFKSRHSNEHHCQYFPFCMKAQKEKHWNYSALRRKKCHLEILSHTIKYLNYFSRQRWWWKKHTKKQLLTKNSQRCPHRLGNAGGTFSWRSAMWCSRACSACGKSPLWHLNRINNLSFDWATPQRSCLILTRHSLVDFPDIFWVVVTLVHLHRILNSPSSCMLWKWKKFIMGSVMGN